MSKFIINTDGASRGNPGHSAVAFIISTTDGVIWVQEGIYLGTATNNEAEYSAVKAAFERLLKDFAPKLPAEIEVLSDSMLITKQLSGDFKIKNDRLKLLFTEVKKLEDKLGKVEYTYIPRSKNYLADRLCNAALDKQLF